MANASTKSKQPPMPGKGASPEAIKEWLAACREQMTPEELQEYEATGIALDEFCKRIDFDPRRKPSQKTGS